MRELARPEADVQAWIETFAGDMLKVDELEALVGQLNRELLNEVPQLAEEPDVLRDLQASTGALIAHLLAEMAKDPASEFEFPPPAVEFARTLARHGHDVGQLMRLYRIGQRVFWRKVMHSVADQIDDGDLRMRVLTFLWEQSSRVLDHNLDVLAAAHGEESERRMRGALARRTETVQAILRGDQLSADEATVRLGHNVRRWQTALVVWAGDAGGIDTSERLESVAVEAAAAVDAPRPLTIRADAHTVWAWLATGPDPALAAIGEIAALRADRGLRIAVGMPALGVPGLRSSHREALRAQRVVTRLADPPQVTLYTDVEVLSCLSEDEEAMRALVRRELGQLARPGVLEARLRQTALAYLRVGGSARRAATELGLHKNTVLYRLRQIEQVLGRSLTERRLPTELALMLAEAYQGRVLTG